MDLLPLVCVTAQPGPLNWCVLLHSLVHSTGVCYCSAWSTQLVCVTAQPGSLNWCVLYCSACMVHSTGVCSCTAWSTQLVCVTAQPGPLNWCVLLHSLVHSTGVCYCTAWSTRLVCVTAQPSWSTQLVCVTAQPGPLDWCVLQHSLIHSTGVCYCTAWSTQLVCVTAQPDPLVIPQPAHGPLAITASMGPKGFQFNWEWAIRHQRRRDPLNMGPATPTIPDGPLVQYQGLPICEVASPTRWGGLGCSCMKSSGVST